MALPLRFYQPPRVRVRFYRTGKTGRGRVAADHSIELAHFTILVGGKRLSPIVASPSATIGGAIGDDVIFEDALNSPKEVP